MAEPETVIYECTYKHLQLGTEHVITVSVPKYTEADLLMSWEEGFAWRTADKEIERQFEVRPEMDIRMMMRMRIRRTSA